jgi:hypothetical protein
MKINMEHWWNDNDIGKPKYSEKNLSQWHFVHYKEGYLNIIKKNFVPTTQKTRCIFITKTNSLMLWETTFSYYENRTIFTNAVCSQNAGFLSVPGAHLEFFIAVERLSLSLYIIYVWF